jgi:KUP system potassium uptake protein
MSMTGAHWLDGRRILIVRGRFGAALLYGDGIITPADIPAALRQARDHGCPIDLENAVYFGARDAVVCSKERGWLVRARLRLFTLMFRNSLRAVDLFNLPPDNFVEVGRQVEI